MVRFLYLQLRCGADFVFDFHTVRRGSVKTGETHTPRRTLPAP